MPHILALDQGTTSSRAIVFDDCGRQRSLAQREFRQGFPQPGWVEHDADEIWATQIAVATEAVSRAGLAPGDLAAIGITNQRETTVVWDRQTGRPIGPAIVWQDRRTAAFCDQLIADGAAPLIQQKTGLILDAYFSASKLRWLLDHVPGARARASAGALAFGTIDSWLIWNLTAGRLHATDVSNASRTMLFNIHSLAWDEDLLKLFDVPASLLPTVRPSSGRYGDTAVSLGLGGSGIAGVAGDQQAALFGQMCVAPGLSKNTYGTGCFLLQNIGAVPVASSQQLVTTVAWQTAEETAYALEGSVFVGGAVVQWLRDGLGLIRSAGDVEALARTVPDSGGVVLVPAFTGLGAPHWDPHARGALVGITRGTTAGHLARAALESIALQVTDLLDAMTTDCGIAPGELRVDGGAAANDTLMQMQADLLGVPVTRPVITETTALGAAGLAGLGAGVWSSPAALGAHWQIDRRFEPVMSRDQARALRAQWSRAVERAKGWAG